MKTLIIDDEKQNIANLRTMLTQHCKGISSIAEAASGAEGLKVIRSTDIDLVFLDIIMPGKSGFDMLAELGKYDFEVVFVTGFDQYAIKAIKFSALDYILKPIDVVELQTAVIKAASKIKPKHSNELLIKNLLNILNNPGKNENRMGIANAKGTELVYPKDIIKMKANNSYTTAYLADRKEPVTMSKPIGEVDDLLSDYGFLRTHESWIVNPRHVKTLTDGDSVLILSDSSHVPVSRNNKKRVKQALIKIR